MKIYTYKPLPNFALGHAEQRIYDYLKEKREARATELYRLSSKRSEPLNRLLERGIVIKTEGGKYRLRKEVSIERSRHSFKCVVSDGRIQDSHIEWYDLTELPPQIRDSLVIPPSVKWELETNPLLPIPVKNS